MTQHYPRSTVSVSLYCKKCEKFTQHRIDFVDELKKAGRKGPCLECIARLEREHAKQPKPAEQKGLFA